MTAYRFLAAALDEVASSRGKLRKIESLAAALRAIGGNELVGGARLIAGSPFAGWA